MLVVLAIVGILAIAGISVLGNRPTLAVRSNLDEIEGVVMGAQQLSMARGGADVYLVADGLWDTSAANFFVLGYDIMKPVDANSPALAVARIIQYSRNPAAAPAGSAPEASFRLNFNPATKAVNRDQENAGVVVAGSPWYTNALNGAPSLETVAPGNVAPLSNALLPVDANNLCQGAAADGINNVAIVSGLSKRWTRDFYICIAGLRGGNGSPGSAVGFVVVPANSGTVYKFVNPGNKDNDGTWRRM
jgi:type II secretory pathway pseudopilin PulG